MKEQKETIAGKERASSGKKGRASRPHPANGLVRNETDFENPGTLAPPEAEVTLAHQVYQQLEVRILNGEWLPNTKVSLRKLALSLETSMQPVRDAVGKLVSG